MSISRVVGISGALQSAIETKLGKKEDINGKDKLIINMNILIGNKCAIVEAAARCSASLRTRAGHDIPTKKIVARTNKPIVAAATCQRLGRPCTISFAMKITGSLLEY